MGKEAEATPKQMKFIGAIEKKLEIEFDGDSIEDADKFIKENLKAFNTNES